MKSEGKKSTARWEIEQAPWNAAMKSWGISDGLKKKRSKNSDKRCYHNTIFSFYYSQFSLLWLLKLSSLFNKTDIFLCSFTTCNVHTSPALLVVDAKQKLQFHYQNWKRKRRWRWKGKKNKGFRVVRLTSTNIHTYTHTHRPTDSVMMMAK